MDNRQTEMALVPPRVEDQERDQRSRMNNLTLESVPGFQRPQSATPNDQIVGMDELGRNIYETPTGQRYTISLNPDQRTARQRIEEDVIPAVGEYLQDPTLPTAEQVGGFARDAVVGAYETAASTVRGQGTLGNVYEMAGGAALSTLPFEVPQGAIRIFGGFERAVDPGRQADRTPLPRSVGADGKERFEIDDSGAEFIPDNLKELDVRSDWENIDFDAIENGFREAPWARLDEIIDHPELFRQYPDLAELRVVRDPSLGASTLGEFWPDKNLISVSSAIANMPDEFARTLLHEIQHGVARREGFDTGTNRFSAEVDRRIEPGVRQYQDDMKIIRENFNNFDYETRIDTMKNFLQDIADEVEADGVLDLDEIVFESKGGRELSLETLLDEMSDNTFEFSDVSYAQLQNFYALFRDNPQLLDDVSAERFENIFNVKPADLEQLEPEGFLDYLEDAGSIPYAPERYGQIIPELRTRAYRTRSGEVEARNVEDRMGLSLEERRQQTPVSTEDVARESQWVVDDEGNIINAVTQEPRTDGMLARAINAVLGRRGMAEGGAVTMDRQMSLFEEGGLMDDGAERDPVSGNEVPAGSMSEEVRDDVPVMLSEGEYVVPADVVRYFGLSFFEDLRNKAKSGLQDMEQDGRIGGEPLDSTPGDEAITEEERMMLMEVMGMAQGGMVPQQQMQQYNPYAMQQQQYSMPQGYQVGGMVTNPYSSSYMPNAFPATSYAMPGSSVFGTPLPTTTPTAPTGGSQTEVTLYSPQGVPFTLRLPRDQQRYNDLLALGYTTEMPQQVTVGTPVQPGVDTGGDGGVDLEQQERERAERAERTRQALTQDPIQFGLDAISGDGGAAMRGSRFGAMLGPVGAVLGGIAGTAITAGNVANARAASTFAQQQGYDTTELDSKIDEFVENLSGPAKMVSKNITGQRRFDNWMNDIWGSGGLGIDDFAPGPAGDAAYKAYTESPDTRQEFIQREELDRGGSDGPGMTAAPERDWYKTGVDLLPPTPGTPSISQETIDRAAGGGDSDSGGTSGGSSDTNVGNWFGDRDGDGVANWRDTNDGVGWRDSGNVQDDSSSSGGGGGGGGGGCFLTTAIVERRGEKDDGETLTKLRNFRDTYLANMLDEVEEYYRVAPRIVNAIPEDHSDWIWIGEQVDKSISFIDKNLLDEAYKTYKAMVKRLESTWL